MCVLAYLPAPTVTLPRTDPRASLSSQPAVRSTPEHPVGTGAVALIPLNCNYLFTHLPLCQTVNCPPPDPPEDGRHAVSDSSHVPAHSRCLGNGPGKDEDVELSHAKVIYSNHSFIPGVIQSISKQIPVECSELDAVHGLGRGFKVSDPSFIHSFSLIQKRCL